MPDPQAQLVRVAEAVAAELRAQTFTLNAKVERKYITDLELKDYGTLYVDVQAGDLESEAVTRDEAEYDCEIGIAIRKRFDTEDEDAVTGEIDTKEIDRLVLLTEEIHAFFFQRVLAAYTDAAWVGVAFRPVYSPTHLREWRQFTGIVVVSYRVIA